MWGIHVATAIVTFSSPGIVHHRLCRADHLIHADISNVETHAVCCGLLKQPKRTVTGKALIAVNPGGCVVPVVYISGTSGVLPGADLPRLADIRKLVAPLASIGGAGAFDGIFITGIVAVLPA
ncbi:MAG: hypothetical protein BMS9Abin36_0621 [Gammaproteobacteria bacterium]|nr:MAG: hypothetical protein BMS9Abin36_0621 [Gammaproteobacteria bacterium]